MIGRAVVTGGAGFLGSHTCERLLDEGSEVVCVDSFLTGSAGNVAHLMDRDGFTILRHDVTGFFEVPGAVDAVLHLASPASPRDYLRYPVHTLKVGSLGTLRALGLAREKRARFLLASTSEVYGDARVHPQPEWYRGNVNPIGPRSAYNESKRFAEALTTAYRREHGVEVRIARIFNTIGPRMRAIDGRVVPAFISQALRDEPFTIHGRGRQTRSICYVSDLVEGLWRLLESDFPEPVNLGNPEEHEILEIARLVAASIGIQPRFRFVERSEDDPQVRRPDIARASAVLGWTPHVGVREGIERTVDWVRERSLPERTAVDLTSGGVGRA